MAGAKLEGTNLEDANLKDAYLYHAHLLNANLAGAIVEQLELSEDQKEQACWSDCQWSKN